MELCLLLCGSLDGREVWGRMDICVCVCVYIYIYIYIFWLSSFTLHLKLTILLISYTQYKIKRLKLIKKSNSQVLFKI